MSVYKFRIIFEDNENIVRDIEIKTTQSFADLHTAIQQAIGFDNSKKVEFFLSDDYWRKTNKISDEDFKKAKLAKFIDDPHQRFIYVFDPEVRWTLLLELFKVLPDTQGVEYPRCVKSVGKSPLQYRKTNNGIKSQKEELKTIDDDEEIDDEDFYKDDEEVAETIAGIDEEDEITLEDMEEDGEEIEEGEEFGASEFIEDED